MRVESHSIGRKTIGVETQNQLDLKQWEQK
jgi:hypothetical protein